MLAALHLPSLCNNHWCHLWMCEFFLFLFVFSFCIIFLYVNSLFYLDDMAHDSFIWINTVILDGIQRIRIESGDISIIYVNCICCVALNHESVYRWIIHWTFNISNGTFEEKKTIFLYHFVTYNLYFPLIFMLFFVFVFSFGFNFIESIKLCI